MQKLSKQIDGVFVNEASVLTETIPAFTWRLLPSGAKPKEHVQGCRDSAQYYLNRILTQFKQKGETTNWPNKIHGVYEALLILIAKDGANNSQIETPAPKSIKPVAKAEAAPKVELQGNRWIIEKGKNCPIPIVITPESIGQAVIIEDCENVRVKVEGKVTAISINRCKRLFLEVSDIVSNVEAMSTTRSDIILLGKVPTVVLDSSEGIKLTLNENSLDTQILSSKCAEINLVVPKRLIATQSEDQEELSEIALPFQFKSTLSADGIVVTEAVKHAGA